METHVICDAIHKHRRVQFWYRGGLRKAEPYAYGVGDGGRQLLRAYQVSGHSHSAAEGWKLFHVEDIREFTTLHEQFESPRDGYMRNDPTMTKIYCEL